MSPDVVFFFVRADDHRGCVPPDQALDAAFELLIARKMGLQLRGDRIYVGRARGEGNFDADDFGVFAQTFEDVAGDVGADYNSKRPGRRYAITAADPALYM